MNVMRRDVDRQVFHSWFGCGGLAEAAVSAEMGLHTSSFARDFAAFVFPAINRVTRVVLRRSGHQADAAFGRPATGSSQPTREEF